MVPEFGVEDLPLGRNAALVPEFVMKEWKISIRRFKYTIVNSLKD